jgi:HEAT repeat protein
VGGPFLASVIDGKSDSLGREFALAALTTYGDLSRLEKMQDYLLTPPAGAGIAHLELGISLERAELGPEQETFLLALTRSTSNELRMTAYHKLADFSSDASIRTLAVGLDDRDAQVRQAAARAICHRTKVCDGEANHFTQREDLRKMQSDLTDLLSRIGH